MSGFKVANPVNRARAGPRPDRTSHAIGGNGRHRTGAGPRRIPAASAVHLPPLTARDRNFDGPVFASGNGAGRDRACSTGAHWREYGVRDYDSDWTDDQRALYDECFALGEMWAADPDTSADQLRQILELAEADEDTLADVEISHPPLLDAVAEVTGETVLSVTADRDDPAFRGFIDGSREGAEGDVFGL